jgi:cathepsin F
MGINKFTDMSKEEFSKKMLPQKVPGAALANSCLAKGVTAPKLDVSALPTAFDWRDKKVVAPVKDQGQCGSCWAFSTVATIESQWAIKGNKLTQFSEQLLVDCSHGCSNEPPYGPVCNQGCDGGWQWNAYSDVITWGGVETETEYPYTAATGTCNMNRADLQAKVTNFTCLSNQTSGPAKEDQMAALLYSHGPLAIALDADVLQYYYSGIVDPWFPDWECDPTVLDHALVIVGWGVEDSEIFGKTPYWIVKNSWGSDWGESGYFRIIRGTGACGINNAVSSVIL